MLLAAVGPSPQAPAAGLCLLPADIQRAAGSTQPACRGHGRALCRWPRHPRGAGGGAEGAALAALDEMEPAGWYSPHAAVRVASSSALGAVDLTVKLAQLADPRWTGLCDLARDLLGDFFHPVSLSPDWLQYNNGLAAKVVSSVYQDHDFSGMPILADALEEAGCDAVRLLEHCRGSGPHAGCWVLDSLLGLT